MKYAREFIINAMVGGVLVLLPIYLAVLVLLKGMQTVAKVVQPIAALLPDWLPGENFLSLLAVLIVCFVVGSAMRTGQGERFESAWRRRSSGRLPGYTLFRSLARELVGEGEEKVWKPVLAEIEEALVPAFIIEELDYGRFTVFVPSIPTPLAGAVYILSPERVHVVYVPFSQAISLSPIGDQGQKTWWQQ